MNIKIIYRKNLKMSDGKLAAQVGHVAANLSLISGKKPSKIIVLKVSDKKFDEISMDKKISNDSYMQIDGGFTEVDEGTETAFGWIEVGE